ncbi:unnamed protein product, partial [Meganyctiphanes norvegica]
MSVVRVYATEEQGSTAELLALQRLQQLCPEVTALRTEICFYIQFDSERSISSDSEDITKRLEPYLGVDGTNQLLSILGDAWQGEQKGLRGQSNLCVESSDNQIVAELGPRLSFSTAWSTNACSICHASGLTAVQRLEKARRYLITVNQLTQKLRDKIVLSLHDPMTQQEYVCPLESFQQVTAPKTWSQVDVLGRGKEALKEINDTMGLAFDAWDIEYYADMFKTKVKRNPTTVELFDLAQSNSEHSRHWFFKGDYIVDGQKVDKTLWELVTNTNSPEFTNNNNVIKFNDNSSAIEGFSVPTLCPSDPSKSSDFLIQDKLRHLIFTAETHNFPTGVAPFSGATTGTGGRIRDVQAAGRGGHVVAGTAGYCFGNLRIPGYDLPWEDKNVVYPSNFADPLEVAIQASNGASDYGNKFGEPVITGFARSFGLTLGDGETAERREWIKPIMFSGGMGTLDMDMVKKIDPQVGYRVVKLGGPIYRIGVGGGAASSVQVQGDNEVSRDLGAVQRGDAQMEQKLNRVIRGCLEASNNPIQAIHDQGAGGNANVLKELMEGAGGVVFTKEFTLGDPTLSTLEIWGAEYQESNAILAAQDDIPLLKSMAQRERCPVNVVGLITGDDKVRLMESHWDDAAADGKTSSNHPVDLHLDWVLGKMPRKVFHWNKDHIQSKSLSLPSTISVQEALDRVLRLPSVASKRYLTNKVDRSVTGLVAQQQCVGPLHTPLADVAVTALSYFSKVGTATSIGEQPIKTLIDPACGSRLTVLEALANMAAAPVSCLKDVKCSANWMWAAKLPGEGWAMYEACNAMCDILKAVGVGVDGGKDSLSMAARVQDKDGAQSVVKAPGALVVSCYAPCYDITKVVTPDVKSPNQGGNGSLLWVRPSPGKARVGGSALAQVYGQVGADSPDVEEHEITAFIASFNIIQQLIKEHFFNIDKIDEGKLILDMSHVGGGGASTNHPPTHPHLVSRDIINPYAVALEIANLQPIPAPSETNNLTSSSKIDPHADCCLWLSDQRYSKCKIRILRLATGLKWELRLMEVSIRRERLAISKIQGPKICCRQKLGLFITSKFSILYVTHCVQKNFEIKEAYGTPFLQTNSAVHQNQHTAGAQRYATLRDIRLTAASQLKKEFLARSFPLKKMYAMIFLGCVSKYVLGSAVGWAASIRGQPKVWSALEEWRQREDTFSLGVCNGCQLMALMGWLDPGQTKDGVSSVRLGHNKSGRFESRWSRVCIEASQSILLKGMEDAKLGVWVAHGEGQFMYRDDRILESLESSRCVALRYVDDSNNLTECYPANPNGSKGGVAGLSSTCGRHLAMMPHPERCVLTWQWPQVSPPIQPNRLTSPWARLFQNAFDWTLATQS